MLRLIISTSFNHIQAYIMCHLNKVIFQNLVQETYMTRVN